MFTRTLFIVLAMAVSWTTNGQTAPETTQLEASGIKIIARESVKGTVSMRTFIRGGVNNYDAEKQGVEELMLSMIAEGGPASTSKMEYQQQLESIGARISASTGYDYGNISLSCIKEYFYDAADIYLEAISNPAFRQEDFDLIKNRMITNAKQAKTNPDAHLMDLAMASTWEGTDYAKKPSGTLESLESLSLVLVKKYYASVFCKQNVFMVLVGDVPHGKVSSMIENSAVSKLAEGKKANWFVAEDGVKSGLTVEDRNIETNYITGVFSAPKKGTEESIHNSLAMRILGMRFFEELRTKRSLSYAPSARSTGYIARPMNQVYISTTDPEQSLEVMIDLVNSVRTEGYEEKELEGTKQSFLTNYYMGQETNSSISMSLGVNEIQGSWKNMDRFTDRVLNTSLEDINTVISTYGEEINWTYLGKEEMVKPKYFKQPVKPKKVKK
ncbi:pitrilysin family protein [Cryomorphaceae bacterium 1068]|nr:pitrilysin family protein [Cryomorphaceae bacterium 1068]